MYVHGNKIARRYVRQESANEWGKETKMTRTHFSLRDHLASGLSGGASCTPAPVWSGFPSASARLRSVTRALTPDFAADDLLRMLLSSGFWQHARGKRNSVSISKKVMALNCI